MHPIITLIICILFSFLSSLLAKKLRLSAVISLIVTGIILGFPAVRNVILEPNTKFILYLGDIGLVCLMFLAGMKVSWGLMYEEKKDAIVVALFAMSASFLLGFGVFLAMGFSFLTSLAVGTCMSITAEATTAMVLMELKKLKTKLGSLMLGAGIIDDVLGMAFFIIITYLAAGSFATHEITVLLIAMLAFSIGILSHKFIGKEKIEFHYLSHKFIGRGKTQLHLLENFLLIFIVPFFFIAMGIYFSVQSLILSIDLLMIIIVTAIIGKILGAVITKPFTKLRLKQLYMVGWGMNARGAVGLAIAFIAFKAKLLNSALYSGMVVMTLVTTLILPFVIRWIVDKEPDIME